MVLSSIYIAGNPSKALTFVDGLMPTAIVRNISVSSFSFNWDTRSLQLSFSDVVNASSFDFSKIQLQSSAVFDNASTEVFVLQQSSLITITWLSQQSVSITFMDKDMDTLKLMVILGKSIHSTFVSIDSGLSFDFEGTEVFPIAASRALQASAL